MTLKERISEDLKNAMKQKDSVKLSILRVIKAEIQRNEQSTNGKIELTDADIVKIVKKIAEGVKETKSSPDELSILESYLPSQLSEDEIKMILTTVKNSGAKNVGDYMKFFKTNYDGQYDGKVLSNLVKEIL